MRRIGIFGAGYVGLVTATSFARLGNDVVCFDIDSQKIALASQGKVAIFEPGLEEALAAEVDAGRLRFTPQAADAVANREFVFIAVGTPMLADGRADLTAVRAAAQQIGRSITGDLIVVNKSTVPLRGADLVSKIVEEFKPPEFSVEVVSNPEFLREGTALRDFSEPDRLVFGVSSKKAEAAMRTLYASIDAPVIVTDSRTAELIKYASNAFLALKISFANEIEELGASAGADVLTVLHGIGSDRRIGTEFLGPGLGYGGSCLPKDVSELRLLAREEGVSCALLDATAAVNAVQIARLCRHLNAEAGELSGKRIAIFGLAFKPQTDDTRNSPALELFERLRHTYGADVVAHDPRARMSGQEHDLVRDPYAAAAGADALVLATGWPEFKSYNWASIARSMRVPRLFDARHFFERGEMEKAGFSFFDMHVRRS